MTTVIPDPDKPEHVAIDGETGELLGGVWIMPIDKNNPAAPTLADFEKHAQHIGWSKGIPL